MVNTLKRKRQNSLLAEGQELRGRSGEYRKNGKGLKVKTVEFTVFFSMLFSLCSLLVIVYGCGPKHFVRTTTDAGNIKRLAVLPFENFTNDEYADEKIRRIVITELLNREIDVIEPGEVTRLLRELKIKSVGSIKIAEIQDMGKTLGADAVMMGSVESFGTSRGISVTYPEVTVNLRLIEMSSGNIIWSTRHTSGGPDFWTRHFGSEGASLSEAARKVVKEAIGTFF